MLKLMNEFMKYGLNVVIRSTRVPYFATKIELDPSIGAVSTNEFSILDQGVIEYVNPYRRSQPDAENALYAIVAKG